jgi:oligopeptide/dipeptide ABC transporter ATP-binding protein
MPSPLLEVEDLHVRFHSAGGAGGRARRRALVHAVNGVDLTLDRGETLGLVGETGCGKSTLGRAILRLVPPTSGRIRLDGADIATLQGDALQRFRRRAQMIFQEPHAALNPRMTVQQTLAEVFGVHRLCPAGEVRDRVAALLRSVGLAPEFMGRLPAQLSGGQCQRIGIARSLAVAPELIVADEPVSALDVSVQAQILNLLLELQEQRRLALLFISHDLSVVRHLCQRVAVMYLGRIVETGPTEAVFNAPRHPYTQALIEALPTIARRDVPLRPLAGEPPSPLALQPGCPFHLRCPRAMTVCAVAPPAPRDVDGVAVRCHLYPPLAGTDLTTRPAA